jgi:acyl-coenzyme A thioesterase PaaI-like protein
MRRSSSTSKGSPTGVADDFETQVAAANNAELTPRRAEMRRVGNALRRIIDKLVATEAPADELSHLAGMLEGLAGVLDPWPQGRSYEGFAESANAGSTTAFFDNSPILGQANPLAPPLVVEVEDGDVIGHARFGAAYEGPPGCVHGGYVAATFDELLGMTQALTGKRGMTGTLTVRYRKPTPLHRDLTWVGHVVREEGRKIFTVGECRDGDTVTAEAEAIFVVVDFARIEALYAERASRDATAGR